MYKNSTQICGYPCVGKITSRKAKAEQNEKKFSCCPLQERWRLKLELTQDNCLMKQNKLTFFKNNRIQSLYNVAFTTSRLQSKMSRHMKKQKNITFLKRMLKSNKKTDPKMTQMLELTNKDFKTLLQLCISYFITKKCMT